MCCYLLVRLVSPSFFLYQILVIYRRTERCSLGALQPYLSLRFYNSPQPRHTPLQLGYFLSFLPLSHILTYVVDLTLFFLEITCTMGYGRVRILTDASVPRYKGVTREFRPTLCNDRRTSRMGDGSKRMVGNVNAGENVTKRVFEAGMRMKKWELGVGSC